MKSSKRSRGDVTVLDYHKAQLAKVPPEVVAEKLKFFRLKKDTMEALPFICLSFEVKPPYPRYKKWLHPLDPISLDDLKNWFGVPNEAAKRMLSETKSVSAGGKLWSGVTNVTPRALPMKKSFAFRSLDQEQRLAVRQTAMNLLYGYADPARIMKAPLAGVVEYMLETSRGAGIKIFAAPDLIVCPDTTVKFENVAALYFNNILIYGNGRIVTVGNTKIHAVQIKHVDV